MTELDEYHLGRQKFPWELWLKSAVWAASFSALIFGGQGVIPELARYDYLWVSFGLLAPLFGLISAWGLHRRGGMIRYACLWIRLSADVLLFLALIFYLFLRRNSLAMELTGNGNIINALVLAFCAWFTAMLIHRDVLFIIATEKLASAVTARRLHDEGVPTVKEVADRIARLPRDRRQL